MLFVLGVAISIPLAVFGGTLIIRLMIRSAVIMELGAALIGWVGGETLISDLLLKRVLTAQPWLFYGAAAAGALFMATVGKVLLARSHAARRVAA